MPRGTDIKKRGFIPIPKDMDKGSWKIEIISNEITYDVTDDFIGGSIDRVATVGLSNFSIDIDNTEGKYKDKFSEGNPLNLYYNYKVKSKLTTIRFRGYIDGIFDNFDLGSGFFISIEGRDAPKSSTNEHFGDTHITLQFTARNNLDCWFGAVGEVDSNGNYSDGILYNSGIILKVYDTSDDTWKVYKDLTAEQKTTLKSQTGYTQNHTNTYVDKSRLAMSQELAKEGDYDFRIYYDSDDLKTYLMVHPENAILNSVEHVTAGQNLTGINRYGKDTTEESNRIKEKGLIDGTILLMRTKGDIIRQSAVWIKDKEETTSSLTKDDELSSKATARLNELKEALKKGTINCCGLPTLQPAEKISFNIPYIVNDNLKVKSFTIDLTALEFNLNIQDKEISFERIFKDRIDENINVSPISNPNGMRNFLVFDFLNVDDYILIDAQISGNVLSLAANKTTGKCITNLKLADSNITKCELRIKANQFWNCSYKISNDNGATWESILVGSLHIFSSTGNELRLEITLNQPTSGVSPEFDKLNVGYK